MTESMLHLIGETFDERFRIEKLIGKGGMGAVFLARHLTMGKEVAIKVLSRELSDEASQVARFNQEAQNSSRLRHPNTIRVFDFGRSEQGYLYIAMEYLEGLELSKVLKRDAPLSGERALHILRQIAKSLAEAHNIGLIHRDVKPDNIFLSDVYGEQDFVKVLDFGIAKVMNDEDLANLTQTGFICGTPTYLAPEIAMGTSITPATDIYSAGVVAYQMLTGKAPFRADSPIAVVMKHVHDSVPEFGPDVSGSEGLKTLVMEMLAKDPARRPANADELLLRLDAVANPSSSNRPLGASPPPLPNKGGSLTDQTRKQEAPTIDAVVAASELSLEDRNAQTSALPMRQVRGLNPKKNSRRGVGWAFAAALLLLGVGAYLVSVERPQAGEVTPAPPSAPEPVEAAETAEDNPSPRVESIASVPKPIAAKTSALLITQPAGATVMVGGKSLGQTPYTYVWSDANPSALKVSLELTGYVAQQVTLTPGAESTEIRLTAVAPIKASAKKPKSTKSQRPKKTRKAAPKKPSRSKKRGGNRWRDFEAR